MHNQEGLSIMARATNKAAAKQTRSNKNAAKRGNATPKVDNNTSTVVDDNKMTAVQRIAAMGDNSRQYFNDVETIAESLVKLTKDFTDKSDNLSFDWTIKLFNMREVLGNNYTLEYLARGSKDTKPNAVQTMWLRKYVPAYEKALLDTASGKPLPDAVLEQNRQKSIDAAELAADRIRVMFNRVVLAAWYLDHVGASELEEVKKGKGKQIKFVFPMTDPDTKEVKQTVGHNSISKLVSAAREDIRSMDADAGKRAGHQSASRKKDEKKTEETQARAPATTKERVQLVASNADSLQKEISAVTAEVRAEMVKAPQVEAFTLDVIGERFGKHDNQHKLLSFDLVAFVDWLTKQPHFAHAKFNGHVVKEEDKPNTVEPKNNGNGKKAA
jgi:hypothetical protein